MLSKHFSGCFISDVITGITRHHLPQMGAFKLVLIVFLFTIYSQCDYFRISKIANIGYFNGSVKRGYSETESAKSRAWRACVLDVLACSRAWRACVLGVLTCLACLCAWRAHVLGVLTCLRAHVLGVLTWVCLRV